MRPLPFVAAALLFVAAASAPLAAAAEPESGDEPKALGKTSGERLLDDAVARVRKGFYDRDKGRRIDWEALASRYRELARSSASPREAHGLVNRMLGELKTSHLALIEGTVYDRELGSEFGAQRTLRAGCELVLVDGRLFVGSVYEDGPAERAGLAAGDEVLELDGVPAERSSLLEEAGHDPGLPGLPGFVLGVKTEEPVRVVARRAKDQPSRVLSLVPGKTSLLDAARASVRVTDRSGSRLGRIHLWHFQSQRMAELLNEAVKGPLHDADALVLDVRGRGGSAAVIGAVLSTFKGERPRWGKPVVALIDRGTRSAKEIFAWSFRRQELGKLVGERTAGAVIGCAFQRLFDGSVLMLPVQDVRGMTRGEQLEGKGVAPDVAVDPGLLPYRAGRDRIAERGEEVALDRLLERARRVYQ